MAIRKFRKNMKPVIWVVTIFFIVGLMSTYLMSLKGGSMAPQLAFKLNGKKVSMTETHRSMARVSENLRRTNPGFDSETTNIVAFDLFLDRIVLLDMGEKLKVKISSSEISGQMDEIEASFPDKKSFKDALMSQGYTTKTLEKEIKENLMLQKVSELIGAEAKVTSEEIVKHYENFKYTIFQGQPLELVQNRIEQELITEKKEVVFAKKVRKARAKIQLENLDKMFENYLEKVEFEFDGVKITNVEYARRILNSLITTSGDVDEAKKTAKSSIESEIKLLKAAEARGVKLENELPLEYQVALSLKELYPQLKSEVKYTESDLKRFFEENRLNYDTQKSASADIAILNVVATEKDEEKARLEAEELLKKLTPENFADMANKYSDEPTAPQGGSLGTLKKGTTVKAFDDAVFSGKIGEIYPEVVKSEFGYHLIFVQEKNEAEETVTASHILIIPKPSEETIASTSERVSQIVADLTNKTITFTDLKNETGIVFSEKIDEIREDGYVPGLGNNVKLTKSIYSSKLGEVSSLKDEKYYMIYRKDSQIEAKKAIFTDFAEQVKSNYIDIKAQELLREIELSTKNIEN